MWHYSESVQDNARCKDKSTVSCTCFLAAPHLVLISTSAIAELEITLTLALKNVVVSRNQDAHAFVDRVAGEVAVAEASLTREVTSRGGRARSSISKES